MHKMIKKLTRAVTPDVNPIEEGVHFHAGLAGPYVCDNVRCVSPRIDPRDAS